MSVARKTSSILKMTRSYCLSRYQVMTASQIVAKVETSRDWSCRIVVEEKLIAQILNRSRPPPFFDPSLCVLRPARTAGPIR